MSQQLALKLNDIFGTVDETNLYIERVVFSEVTAGCVRLGSIHMTRLKNSLKTRNSVFLVKLRALCQVSDAVKVIQFEEIRSPLGPRRNNLRSDNLGEAVVD